MSTQDIYERFSTHPFYGVLIVSIPALIVILWYLVVQNGRLSYNFSTVRNNPIILSFRSVVSHTDMSHLLLNVLVYLLFSIPLVFIYRKNYVILLLLLLGIIIEIAKYTEYTNIFGISGFVRFVAGCFLLSLFYSIYIRNKDNIPVAIQVSSYICLIAILPPTIGDILIVTEVVSTDNLGYVSYLFYGSMPNSYVKVSSVVHIDGIISGLSATSGLIIMTRQLDIEVFER